jgi:hypothetical protein
MLSRTAFVAASALAMWSWSAPSAHAAVVVLANRTDAKVRFTIATPGQAGQPRELDARDVVPFPVGGTVEIAFDDSGARRTERLPPYTAAAFDLRDGRLGLYEYPMPPMAPEQAGPSDRTNGAAAEPPVPETDPRRHAMGVMPVMILVDEDERAVRTVWEERLRQRMADASAVFERACRIRLEVVAVGTWPSDNGVRDFAQSLREFELKVIPAPARLAIGFTSQYEIPRGGQMHLGGTRGPLYPYILIREYSPRVGEAQRLETLVHELGHFLGATHCAEPNSVMRPVLTDRRSNARKFRIGFDAANTLAMYQVAEELRTRGLRDFTRLTPETKARLRGIYGAMGKTLPGDNAAPAYIALLDQVPGLAPEPVQVPEPVVAGTRAVVGAIVAAAGRRRGERAGGDPLAEQYVRAAAAAACKLPKDVAAKSFLLGLGIGLDDSMVLRGSPILGPFCRQVESDDERTQRLAVLGQPTVRGRRDLAQHFVLSCTLTERAGPHAAEAAGLLKELLDSRRGSGFSFVDLAADLAGVSLARRVLDGHIELATLADSFRVADYVPEIGGLREGIGWESFLRTYGSAEDERFQGEMAAIRTRIEALAAYRDKDSR